jgi:succinate dehydrogenase hydrophobic anchor subunit
MLNSATGVLAAVMLLLPGFIAADLAETGRARLPKGSAWELALRALVYAVGIHAVVALPGWTEQIVTDTRDGHRLSGHVDAVVLYVAVVAIIVPTVLGLALAAILRRAELAGQLRWFHYALGGRDARQAWDYVFQRYGKGFVVLRLKGEADEQRTYVVEFGRHSWATQTPSDSRDVYFQRVWPADEDGRIRGQYAQRRGMWIPVDAIESLQFTNPPSPAR